MWICVQNIFSPLCWCFFECLFFFVFRFIFIWFIYFNNPTSTNEQDIKYIPWFRALFSHSPYRPSILSTRSLFVQCVLCALSFVSFYAGFFFFKLTVCFCFIALECERETVSCILAYWFTHELLMAMQATYMLNIKSDNYFVPNVCWCCWRAYNDQIAK